MTYRTVYTALESDNPSRRVIAHTGLSVTQMVLDKNAAYGDSALRPLPVFSKHLNLSAADRLTIRMDDKINRLLRTDRAALNEDALLDLVGYGILYMALEKLND